MTITPQIGTIIHGTMRAQDLIPAFADALDRYSVGSKNADLIAMARAIDWSLVADHPEWRFGAEEPWRFWLNANDILEALFDRLDELAPAESYFGAHPGDGADYGFWPTED